MFDAGAWRLPIVVSFQPLQSSLSNTPTQSKIIAPNGQAVEFIRFFPIKTE